MNKINSAGKNQDHDEELFTIKTNAERMDKF